MLHTLTRRLKQPRAIHFFFPTLLLIALAGRAGGQTIVYSNLSTSSANPIQNYTGIGSLAQSFTPSASGFVSSLALNLQTLNPSARPNYDVQLWSSSGGPTPLPATLLAAFVEDRQWNHDLVSPSDSSHLVTLLATAFSQNYSLTSGTTYWLVVVTTDGAFKSWGVSAQAGGPTAMRGPNSSTWLTFPLSGALGAEVSLTAIPEPGAYAAWGGMAVLGLAAYSRRRRRASRP